jgi:cephalosporin hydroxylase
MNPESADPIAAFEAENRQRIDGYTSAADWVATSAKWRELAFHQKYMYHFSWLGRPVIQLPADIVAMQELIWRVKPDLIIETGIAHGGSLVLSASILAMLDYADAVQRQEILDPSKPKRSVVGIDIDIRAHNRAAIDGHPMRSRIKMIEGSSLAPDVADQVRAYASGKERIMVALDSNHTHGHVLEELRLYAPLVTPGSYCIVFDTVVEDLPHGMFPGRPWDKGNSPKSAVWEYLKAHPEFEIDRSIHEKLLVTAAPDGFLKRLR